MLNDIDNELMTGVRVFIWVFRVILIEL
jgi:hypothetical protein